MCTPPQPANRRQPTSGAADGGVGYVLDESAEEARGTTPPSRPRLPIIAVTAYAMLGDQQSCVTGRSTLVVISPYLLRSHISPISPSGASPPAWTTTSPSPSWYFSALPNPSLPRAMPSSPHFPWCHVACSPHPTSLGATCHALLTPLPLVPRVMPSSPHFPWCHVAAACPQGSHCRPTVIRPPRGHPRRARRLQHFRDAPQGRDPPTKDRRRPLRRRGSNGHNY